MTRVAPLAALLLLAGCAVTSSPEPSLAPRAAEAIDPRVPIPDAAPVGTVNPELAARLRELVAAAQGNAQPFETREADASQLAAQAGPMASESWVAAQQALSRLVEQYGVTTQAAADIDSLATARIEGQRWIAPADREAIAAAIAEVAAISDRQAAAIAGIKEQLAR